MRRRPIRIVFSIAAVLVLAGGGYVTADAYDVVPGRLTLDPVPPTPAAFPTAPAATDPSPIEAAVAALDTTAPIPAPGAVTDLATGLAQDARMGTSVGIVVTDVLTGQVLADIDGAKPRTPASTDKLLTAAAAVSALGLDRTLSTRVVQPAPGQIVLVGGGDMMLAAGAGNPDAVNGRAGLADLAVATARSLQLAGITQVGLGVDDTLFTGPSVHSGWGASNMIYVAPIAALAVNIGKTKDEEYPPRQADPAITAAETFAARLAEQGIVVTGVGRSAVAPGAVEIAAVESAPICEIVEYTVQLSENTIAEVLGRLVAVERGLPGSFAGATSAVVAEVGTRQGIDTTGVNIADCSGLAAGSSIPAGVLANLLVQASAPGNATLLPVVVDLPVSGWQGTLSDRFVDGPARGLLRAKTGSLPGVTALAGTLLTQEGRLLALAVLADATPAGGQTRPREAIDAFVQQLAVTATG